MLIKVPWRNPSIIPDKYTSNAADSELWHGFNLHSFPFGVLDLPKNTKSISFALIDYDQLASSQQIYINWLVANVPVGKDSTMATIPDNAALSMLYTRGRNSYSFARFARRHPLLTKSVESLMLVQGYGGPNKKSTKHKFVLQVWAFDDFLNLEPGFSYATLMEYVSTKSIATGYHLFNPMPQNQTSVPQEKSRKTAPKKAVQTKTTTPSSTPKLS